MEELELELENRIKNLMWTISGDYSLDFKPDLQAFSRSKYIALYDGIKQGAFARFFDREEFSLYLVKKIYLHGMEAPLLTLAQLCIDCASTAPGFGTSIPYSLKSGRRRSLKSLPPFA